MEKRVEKKKTGYSKIVTLIIAICKSQMQKFPWSLLGMNNCVYIYRSILIRMYPYFSSVHISRSSKLSTKLSQLSQIFYDKNGISLPE